MLGKVNQIMRLFEGVDIEMFDINYNIPIDGEFVIIVLKQEKSQKSYVNFHNRTYIKGNAPFSLLRVCRTKIYRRNRIVFFDSTGKAHEQHTADDIICWGKMKP